MRITKAVCELAKVAAKKSARYATEGVLLYRVDSKTVRAEAVDGRRLVRLEWADKGKGKFRRVLPLKACKQLGGFLGVGRCKVAFVLVDELSPKGKIDVTVAGVYGKTIVFDEVPGTFPNLDKVIPRYGRTKAVKVGVNPKLWNGVMEAMTARDGNTVTVTLPLADPRKRPVLFESVLDEGGVPIKATGVLMQRML